jgi:transposase
MFASLFATLFAPLRVIDIQILPDSLTITARSATASAVCPRCGHASSSIHSSYIRAPHDLPVSDHAVRLVLYVRRFRCYNVTCSAITFAERLHDFLQPYAQRTIRHRSVI